MSPSPSLIAIDVREACRARRAGKAQWTYGLVTELLRREEQVLLLTDAGLPAAWRDAGARFENLPGTGFVWHRHAASFLRASQHIRFYLSPTSYIVPALVGFSFPCVPVVHDLIAFRPEPHHRRARLIERLTLGRTVRKAARILTISDATKQDLLARYPALDPRLAVTVFAGPMRREVPSNVTDHRTILCVATLSPRKNQLKLIRAFASLPEQIRHSHRLVLAGARGWDDAEILTLARSTPGVEWREYVDDAEYERLLHSCAVFALPSLYEGFGMQILDALQRGIPVLTSNRGSLAEVAGDAACVADPESVESIAAGLLRLLTDETYAAGLRERGPKEASRYSWERTAELVLGATATIGM